MRHRKSGRKLKRTSSHRKATLNALCTALLLHKKIQTTVAKAKETRMVVEKMITRAKIAVAAADDKAKNVHARRQVGRHIKDKVAITELFSEIAPKVMDRPGGYTRIVKLGQRHGDAAEIAIIELVDFNTGKAPSTKKTAAAETTGTKKAPAEPKTQKKKEKEEAAPTAAEAAAE